MIPSPHWAIQADVEGPRSDRIFYRRLGISQSEPLAGILEVSRPGIVISVRLHGAIAALLSGRPAIHLAYERKGWGAYEDLGLAEFVHDARTFDVANVASQARSLHVDPSRFWAKIRTAVPTLQRQYSDLVTDLRQRLTA
jgi:polysaccharide pyruvyl transferase WcaK-like protein